MTVKFWKAVATMTGTVVGAGVLGLPYVVAKAGFLTGLITIALLGVIIVLLALYFGEVVLRTKGTHQMVGYAERYLGKFGKILLSIIFVFSVTGALTAYSIGVGASLYSIAGIGNEMLFSLIFFGIGAVSIFYGLKIIEGLEFILFCIMLVIITIILGLSFANFNPANVELTFNLKTLLLPYGVALFAFLGLQAIPEMKIELAKKKRLLKPAILIGMLIPCGLYLLFPAAIVGVSGSLTSEIATVTLGKHLGLIAGILGNLFAITTMSTSFLILGLALRDVWLYDYKLPKLLAWVLTCTVPLLLTIFKVASFIRIVGIVGIFMGGIEGILVALMIMRAKKYGDRKPEYSIPFNWVILLVLIALFIGGTTSYFIYFVL